MKTRPNEETSRAVPGGGGGSESATTPTGNSSSGPDTEGGQSNTGASGASAAADKPKPGDALKIQPIAPPPAPPPQATQTSVPSAKIEPVRPPSLSLPKGGGAMRPMGDTFKTNPSTGTGSYAIPIPAPSARGFGPSLALSYDSGSGNGPFGLGWSLSLGAVSRRTDRRLPRYDDAGDSDIFVLSGAEELVPENPPLADSPAEAYQTIRYRPRTEGGFAKIERRTLKATGESHWVVRSGDGGTRWYGRAAASRIADPKDERRVFSWLLDRAEDDRGNVLEVEYAAEDLANVDVGDCAESHRTMPHRGVEITNRYPKRVRWGNMTMGAATLFPAAPAQTEALFEVVFDYGEHDALIPTPEPASGVTWSVRQDPFSSYRVGFEIRTYRLCRRVLVFHRFAELGATPCLVSSVDFGYAESPSVTLLQSATHRGYVRQPDGTYQSEAVPTLTLDYSLPTKTPKTLTFDPSTLDDVDVKTIGRRAQWVDLDGEGLSGLLSREGGQLRYKHNLSGGRFTKAAPIATEPSIGAEQAHIADIDGNGILTFVKMEGPLPGSFAREAGEFGAFRPFVQLPNGISWSSARVNLIDLNGDGRDDLLVVTDRYYLWYPSLGAEGFGEPYRIPIAESDDIGPSLWPSTPPHMGVFFADMTGDGQADLVRVMPGQVAYWSHLGNGRFGAMVVMRRAPLARFPKNSFDPRRIRFADVDGSGTADLIYFDDRAYIFWNEAGNAFSETPTVVDACSGEAAKTAGVVDAFGRGTAQIVWARGPWMPPGDALMAVDVVGSVKPYLLTSVKNGFGLETRVEYAPSTKFYLADKAAGTPWAHPLPFPVHVVAKVEVYDGVRRHRFVQTYAYHHGGYDPDEREFRGFGRVDTLDVETTEAHEGKGLFADLPAPLNGERPQPPVLTKTWFHLGIVRHARKFAEAYAKEQWAPPLPPGAPPGTPPPRPSVLSGPAVLEELPDIPSNVQWHEAMRAMRGQTLRVEVYGLDGTPQDNVPVQVVETRVRVRQEQAPRGGSGATANHAVMFVHGEEAVTFHYEKVANDPRVSHALTLHVDDYGVATRDATVVYGRNASTPHAEQQETHVVVGTRQLVHFPANEAGSTATQRLAVPLAEQVYELKMAAAPPGSNNLYTHAELKTAFQGATEVPYEATATGGQKRLLGSAIHRYYDSANLPAALAEGAADPKALPYESYGLSLTPGLVTGAFGTKVDAALLVSLGYQDRGTAGFWVTSGRQVFEEDHFYLPSQVMDAFGRVTTLTYDQYRLFVTEVADPLGNTVAADMDYRLLAPWQTTDPNGNRGQVAFDALGRVTKAAVLGKAGSTDGDTLADPTIRYTYDAGRWQSTNGQKPGYVKTEHREAHGAANPRWQVGYAFFDGGGGVALAKAQAEPETVGGPARWVATGRTVANNKGNPIKQYEPYFSSDWEWEWEEALSSVGVTAIATYDAMGRVLQMDMPDGTTSRVAFSSWHVEQWDPNDTVADTGNLWRLARTSGAVPTPAQEDIRAKNLALAHAATPSVVHLDSLGRGFLAIADNGAAGQYTTKTVLDLEGQVRAVVDALGRTCAEYDVSVDGRLLHEVSIDAGEKWALGNALGTMVRAWNAVGHVTRVEVDALERLTHLWVASPGAGGSGGGGGSGGAATEALRTRVLYGEGEPSPEVSNLRGRACVVFDGAGVVETGSFDFKGNLLATSRRLAADYTDEPDWTPAANSGTRSAALAQASSLLENETFSKAFSYDALNRTTSATMPDQSEVQPTYNEAGQLESVQVRVRGATNANGQPIWTTFVTGIAYDEKGRRTRIDYGNGTFTEYFYDPLSFRLTRLRTMRSGDGAKLQDLFYFYDPVGNITTIRDDAHQTVFFAGQQVTPTQEFEYDAIYRLISATGREHAGGVGDLQRDNNDLPLWNLPHPNDAQALRTYTETYAYDGVGNILEMFHDAGNGSPGTWRRKYAYGTNPFGGGGGGAAVPASNRLHSTSLPGDSQSGPYSATYSHDANGNMVSMPHLAELRYTHADQMKRADLGGGGTAYYTYDASGERVRKVIQRLGTTREERIYLGGWELYRKRQGASYDIVLERETLHVTDDARRIAMIETKTVDADVAGTLAVVSRTRYQYGNRLDSAHLECDEAGLVISYEEYHPYGTPAYRSARSGVEASEKRYRYTGKERDEETGFQYHSARYLAPWLGRWTVVDPKGMVDGCGVYSYCLNNPVGFNDLNGTESSAGATAYFNLYQTNRFLADTLAAAGAAPEVVANLRTVAENWRSLAEGEQKKAQTVPVLAAVIPPLAQHVRPASGSTHPAVAAYRNLTGTSALHTQPTTAGASALLSELTVGAALGIRYAPRETAVAIDVLAKPISEEMHFEDPERLKRVVTEPARAINRLVKTIEELLTPPPPMEASPNKAPYDDDTPDDETHTGVIEGVEAEYHWVQDEKQNWQKRYLVKDEYELMQIADNAAGGSINNLQPHPDKNFYEGEVNGTRIKIEWETQGHPHLNEGPHVKIQRWDPQGGKGGKGKWGRPEKIFIKGHEKYGTSGR